jgi:hypothetical protein
MAREADMNTRSTMRQKVQAYLEERRQVGCALRVIGSQLRSFARFAEDLGHRGPLTLDLALGWAQASRRARPLSAAGRLAQLRPFAQFCHRLDPASAIPPAQFFGRAYRHLTPHVYSPEEIRALLAAAAQWPLAGCLRAHSFCPRPHPVGARDPDEALRATPHRLPLTPAGAGHPRGTGLCHLERTT